MSFAAWIVNITMEHSQKMETYHKFPGHCKLRRYEVELRGTVGKDVAKHQRGPTSCSKERCCESLLDVGHPVAEIPAKEVSSKVPCEKGESSAKVRRSDGTIVLSVSVDT